MITVVNIAEPSVVSEIHALQQAAYSVEAQRIGCVDFPPLRETRAALQRSADSFLVFTGRGRILGCLSYERNETGATITRLIVSPQHFRRGIARALLRALDSRLPVGSVIRASTAALNEPAIRAYEKQGYQSVSEETSSEGIALRRVQKQLGR